jgi:type I restriction enzyme R subunit
LSRAPAPSPNFAFLAYHDPRLVALATQAELSFPSDPVVCLFKLRLFAEILAQRAVANVGLYIGSQETQLDLVNRLFDEGVIHITQRNLFHDLRRVGNAAVHENRGDHAEALHQLKMARELAVWFQRSFGNNRKFDPGPFVPPLDPDDHQESVADNLLRLRKQAAEQAETLRAAQLGSDTCVGVRWSGKTKSAAAVPRQYGRRDAGFGSSSLISRLAHRHAATITRKKPMSTNPPSESLWEC